MKASKKWIVGATSAALVASAIVPVASAASFSDIENNDHKDAILALAEAGIISGYTDGTFKPNAVVTRGNVTKLLGKWLVSEGYEIPADYNTVERFTDLPTDSADQELVKYAALVKEAGVFKGSNGKLLQANNMSREQMAVVLVRALNTVYGVDLVADYKAANFESKITDLEKATADENREAIIALEYAELTTVTAFNPKNSLTRGQFASFLHRAISTVAPAELTVKTVTVKDATTLEVTLSDDSVHTVTLENALKANEETTVEFVIDGKTYSAKVKYEVAELKVESVTAVTSKTLKVTFNTAAAVTAESFTVTKGSVKANIAKVEIAEDGKSANIELTSKLTEGEYTVTVAQEGKDALTGKVTVQNEKLSAIEILSEEAIITAGTLGDTSAGDKASTTVKITNQYGEDITKLNTGVTITVSGAGTVGTLKSTGELELEIKDSAKIGDLVIVTIVDTATGVSTSKSLKLSDKAVASEVAFGELYNKDGKTLSQDTDLTKDAFYLPITVKDQYGKEIVDPAKATGIVVTNANDTVATFGPLKAVKINGKEVLVVEVTSVNFAGTTNVVAVSTTSGKSAQAAVTVAPGVKVSSLTVSAPAELVTANKDVYFPLTIVDTNGNEVKSNLELAKIKDTVSVSTGTIVDKNAKGEAGLFVKVVAGSVVESTPLTVVATSTSGKVSTQTVVPKAEAVATVITGINPKLATALRAGDATGLVIENTDLIVEDQYGQVITDTTVLSGLTFKAESDDTDALTATNGTLTKADKEYTIKPVANTTKTGAKITFTLLSGTASQQAASAFVKSYSIVQDAEFVSYEIADVKPVKVETADSGLTYTVSSGYDQEFKVTAKTKEGATVTLVAGTDYTVQGVTVSAAGKVTAPGKLTFADKAVTTTKDVKVVINRTGEELTKTLTFSTAAPKAVTIVSRDADKKELNAVEVNTLTNSAFDFASLEALTNIVSTDQYGKETTHDNSSNKVDSITFTPVTGTATFTGNGTDAAKITNATVGTVVDAKLTVDGQSTTVRITFKAAVDTVAPTATGFALALNDDAAETITISFSEAINLDDNTTVTGFTTSSGTIATAVYKKASNTVVLTSSADGEFTTSTTVSYATSHNVKDAAGNELQTITTAPVQ